MIEITDIHKAYERADALQGFTATIEAGEIFGLVGPNGAGKTTLLTILATLVRADSGRVHIAGHDVAANPREVRRLTGYLPDVPGLYQQMRVREFLSFFADAFHLRGAARQHAIAKALRWAELEERQTQFVEQLSLGYKQRLLLAKTLLHGPRVLLLDEPATGLDPLARVTLREMLKQVNQAGVTVVISSHILSDLEDLCHRVAFIDQGRNVNDPQGRSIVVLGERRPSTDVYAIEVLGDRAHARNALAAFSGTRIVSETDRGFQAELVGGREQAAALLRHLIADGVSVVRFSPGGETLEASYRKTFTGERE